MQSTTRYTIYIGLFDKDTKTQIISTKKALGIISQKITEKFGGWTIYPSSGVYAHDDWKIVQEPSIVIQTMTNEDVSNFVNELKVDFNQESVLVNKEVVEYAFA